MALVDEYGVVSGVSAGTVIISYSFCSAVKTKAMTVNPLPSVPEISAGSGNVCVASTLPLSESTSGGTHLWTSSDVSVATVNTSSGIVTGISEGTATISYRHTLGCTDYTTSVITVNPVSSTSITGTQVVCVGESVVLAGIPVGGTWSSSTPAKAVVDNTGGIVTGIAGGTAKITYVYSNEYGCSAQSYIVATVNALPYVASIGGANSVCAGLSITLTDVTTGGIWSSLNEGIATIGSISGAVAALSAGTTRITYAVTGSNGCIGISTKTVSVNPLPSVSGIIAPASSLCPGSTLTLTDTTTGGSYSWISNNTSVAIVSSGTGVVTGMAPGTVMISYKYTLGCINYATIILTVNSVTTPSITGDSVVCVGSSMGLSGYPAGGVWSSSSTGRALVGSSSGIVSGVAGGTAKISYTYTNEYGCMGKTYINITVNTLPSVASISGASTVCVGTSVTLSNSTAGGIWTSSDTGIATIDNSSGLETGIYAGTAVITYTFTGSNGCSNFKTKNVTVNPTASVATITGATSVNTGATITLSNTTSGGSWSSSNTSRATVNASGVVTGVSAGTVYISYTITNCGTATAVHTVNVTSAKQSWDISPSTIDIVSVYPNPVKNTFSISAPEAGGVIIYATDGKQIIQYQIEEGITYLTLPNDIAAGVYICRYYRNSGDVSTIRMVYTP